LSGWCLIVVTRHGVVRICDNFRECQQELLTGTGLALALSHVVLRIRGLPACICLLQVTQHQKRLFHIQSVLSGVTACIPDTWRHRISLYYARETNGHRQFFYIGDENSDMILLPDLGHLAANKFHCMSGYQMQFFATHCIHPNELGL